MITPVLAQGPGNAFFGQNIRIQAGETLDGDTSIFGGTATFDRGSVINGDVAVMGGEVTVNGTINGDLVAFGGIVDLGATAVIEGDVVALGAVRRHPDAQIHGRLLLGLAATRSLAVQPRPWPNTADTAARPVAPRLPHVMTALRALATLFALLMAALAAVLILPDNLSNINQVMLSSAPLSAGVGALTLVVLAVLTPLLVVICIGIPVAMALLLVVAVGALVGWVAAGKALGARVMALAKVSPPSAVVEALLGVLLLTLAGYVPCVGWLFAFVALCWGLGATVLTRFGVTRDAFWKPFGAPPVGPALPAREDAELHATGGASSDTRPLADELPE
jgi:hypothetical protein